MKNVTTLILLLLTIHSFCQQAQEEYIDAFAPVAISEMHRTGIPASIKLAQAILESNAGQSEMAQLANNHFGIKCGNNWSGARYMHEDDEKDWKGKLKPSCFRTYSDAQESFIEHSNFLMNNGKESRYAFLFDYPADDYKNWAKGLKKAGYASDPKYAQKLINIIEKYELHYFDDQSADIVQEYWSNGSQNTSGKKELLARESVSAEFVSTEMPDFRVYNKVKMVLTDGHQTLGDIAFHFGITDAEILKYNDGYVHADRLIPANRRIYLEPKRNTFSGKKKFHKVREGERMEEIAQHYAVNLNALYLRNKIPFGSQVKPGELVQLKGLIRGSERPELIYRGKRSITKTSRFVEETVEYIFNPKNATKD